MPVLASFVCEFTSASPEQTVMVKMEWARDSVFTHAGSEWWDVFPAGNLVVVRVLQDVSDVVLRVQKKKKHSMEREKRKRMKMAMSDPKIPEDLPIPVLWQC